MFSIFPCTEFSYFYKLSFSEIVCPLVSTQYHFVSNRFTQFSKFYRKLLWDKNITINLLPDFPTGATILNRDEVIESLNNGNGKACKIRASVEFDSVERCFIVKEMPYSTYTNTICKELANIMQEDENCGIKGEQI